MHVLCSVFIPEITFSDAAQLKLVEGISAIPAFRWQHVSPARLRAALARRCRSLAQRTKSHTYHPPTTIARTGLFGRRTLSHLSSHTTTTTTTL